MLAQIPEDRVNPGQIRFEAPAPKWKECCYIIIDNNCQTRAVFLKKEDAIKAAESATRKLCVYFQVNEYPLNAFEDIYAYDSVWTSEKMNVCCCSIGQKLREEGPRKEPPGTPQNAKESLAVQPPAAPQKRRRKALVPKDT